MLTVLRRRDRSGLVRIDKRGGYYHDRQKSISGSVVMTSSPRSWMTHTKCSGAIRDSVASLRAVLILSNEAGSYLSMRFAIWHVARARGRISFDARDRYRVLCGLICEDRSLIPGEMDQTSRTKARVGSRRLMLRFLNPAKIKAI